MKKIFGDINRDVVVNGLDTVRLFESFGMR